MIYNPTETGPMKSDWHSDVRKGTLGLNTRTLGQESNCQTNAPTSKPKLKALEDPHMIINPTITNTFDYSIFQYVYLY